MKNIQTSAVRRTTAILAVCGSIISATAQDEAPQKDPESGIQAVSKPKLALPILFKNPPAAKKQDLKVDAIDNLSKTTSTATTGEGEVESDIESAVGSKESSPLLPATTASAREVDFAKMKAIRIKIPALESIPENDLPALLRSEDAPITSEPTDEKAGLFKFLKSPREESAEGTVAEEAVETRATVVATPVIPSEATPAPEGDTSFAASPAPANNDVQRLQGAESQADSFRAALAVAVGGESNLPAQPQAKATGHTHMPVSGVIEETGEVVLPTRATESPRTGFFSRFGKKLKREDSQIGAVVEPETIAMPEEESKPNDIEITAEEIADPVSNEKKGFLGGLFSADKKAEAEVKTTEVTVEEIPETKTKKHGWFNKTEAAESVDAEEVLESEEKKSPAFFKKFGKKEAADSEQATNPKEEKSGFNLFKREPAADAE